jgi:hypothetical protein
MEIKKADGGVEFKNAKATGMNFFKPSVEQEEILDDLEVATSDAKMSFDRPINYEEDLMIDLEKTQSRYVRFNGRANDENLEIEDIVSVLIDSNPESTNILLF